MTAPNSIFLSPPPAGHDKPTPHRPPACFSPAFNLLEVLFAIGIFAVGFVAVASLFPAAALLQKYAADDLNAQQLGVNIQSALQSRKFTLTSSTPQPYDLSLLPEPKSVSAWSDTRNDFVRPLTTNQFLTPGPNCWTISDRSTPSNTTPLNNRKYIWVPLAKCNRNIPPITSATADWTFYIFILQRDQGKFYPRSNLASPGWANFFPGTTGILNDGWVDGNGNNNADLSPTDTYLAPGVRSMPVTSITSPSVFNIDNNDGSGNLLIRPGDIFLDSNGVTYTAILSTITDITVTSQIPTTPATPNRLWFSQRANPDDPCPTLRIITVNDAVE